MYVKLHSLLVTDLSKKCEYNSVCLMSSGLRFDDIIMNIFKKKILNQHMEVIDSYFTKIDDINCFCTDYHFNIFLKESYT